MATRAIPGFGGTLTLTVGGATKTIPVRNVSITRQASEYDITLLSDTKTLSAPGRVKRGGSFDAYVSTETTGITTAIDSPSLATPASLTFTDAAATVTTMAIIITGADQKHDGGDAAVYSVTFTETISTTV